MHPPALSSPPELTAGPEPRDHARPIPQSQKVPGPARGVGATAQALLVHRCQCFLEASGIERTLCSCFRSQVARTSPDLVLQGHRPLADTSLKLFSSYKKGKFGHPLSLQAVSL